MTEIAIRSGNAVEVQSEQHAAMARLADWAQAADAAYMLAERLVGTTFAPAAYRGKPEEATAAILAGAEVGLSPMASLRAFDNIQGTPAPKAITLRAIAQGQGHEIRIDESTAVLASVSGRRKGTSEWQTSTWTIERADQMGLMGKEQWKKQPAAMLVARATAEICRWVASDAILGMPYSAEEVRDEGEGFEARPQPRRVTAAEILRTSEIEPAPEPAHPREIDAAPAEPALTMMSEAQKRKIFALLKDRGITDRDARLAGISRVIDREITTTNELTAGEATQVIESLERSS